jgi:hypothetical protein
MAWRALLSTSVSEAGRRRSRLYTHKEVIPGHAGLPGDTGGDDDNVGSFESTLGAVVRGKEARDLSRGRDVGEVGGDLERLVDVGKLRYAARSSSRFHGDGDELRQRARVSVASSCTPRSLCVRALSLSLPLRPA